MKGRPLSSMARKGITILVVANAFLAAAIVRAEILPTEGTFRGIYYQNRAGVGHFKFFIVSGEQTKQLAPYNGKYIELEVVSGIQPVNPGPAFIKKIGRVTELPPPPLQVDVKTVCPGSSGPGTFDIVYSFKNGGRSELILDVDRVGIGLEGYRDVARPDEVDKAFGRNLTNKQYTYGGQRNQPWNLIHPMSPGKSTHFYTKRIKLLPGEAVPFVWHGINESPGEHEVVVSAALPSGGDEPIPVMFRKALDLPLERIPVQRSDLTIHAKAARDAEWLTIEGRLCNETEGEKSIFAQPDGDQLFLPGLVQLEGPDGKLLSIDLDWEEPYTGWTRKYIAREGTAFRFRVRQSNHFHMAKESRLCLWTVTDDGLEKLTVADDLPAPPIVRDVPWGKAENGCRLRIRMAKDHFAIGEQPRFFVEIESDGTSADILWINGGDSKILVDGEPAKLYTTALVHDHVLGFPRQGEIKLAHNHGLAEGKHNLTVEVQGRGGEYTNLTNRKFRKFEGKLISNAVEFSLGE